MKLTMRHIYPLQHSIPAGSSNDFDDNSATLCSEVLRARRSSRLLPLDSAKRWFRLYLAQIARSTNWTSLLADFIGSDKLSTDTEWLTALVGHSMLVSTCVMLTEKGLLSMKWRDLTKVSDRSKIEVREMLAQRLTLDYCSRYFGQTGTIITEKEARCFKIGMLCSALHYDITEGSRSVMDSAVRTVTTGHHLVGHRSDDRLYFCRLDCCQTDEIQIIHPCLLPFHYLVG